MKARKWTSAEGKAKKAYQVRWKEGNKRRAATFPTHREAEEFKAQRRRLKQLGELVFVERGRMLLSEHVEDWWEKHAMVRLERATKIGYRSILRQHILPQLGNNSLAELEQTPELIDNFHAYLITRGIGAPQRRKTLMLLQGILEKAVKWRRIRANPAKLIDKPRMTRTRIPKPLTVLQIETMRAFVLRTPRAPGRESDATMFATIISVLAYAGLRPGECLGLTWDHVRGHVLIIERAVSMTDASIKGTKTGRVRSVRMPDALIEDLAHWRNATTSAKARDLVFPSVDGSPWDKTDWKNWHRRVFRPAAEAAGLTDARPYDLRHSFCSHRIFEGWTAVEVAANAGHAPTMTLNTYAHAFAEFDPRNPRKPLEEQIEEAREALNVRTRAARGPILAVVEGEEFRSDAALGVPRAIGDPLSENESQAENQL